MAREISGNLVTMSYATDLNNPLANLKTIVCEEESDGGLDGTVNTTPTKCGTFSTVEDPVGTINGSGVVNVDPDSDEASFQELLTVMKNKQRVYAVYQNEAEAPDVTAGQGVFMAGHGYFSSVRETATQGTQVKFTWAFTFSGPIDTEYPASA
jgi:hypothetical protein